MSSIVRKSPLVIIAIIAPMLFAAESAPKLSYEQMEQFLQNAKIVSIKNLSVGVTSSQRAKLDDGTLQHDAHVQCIDEAKTTFQGQQGTEMNFRDTWKFGIHSYLGITISPR